MEAIITKYHGPKASGKGATICAHVVGGERVSISYPSELKMGYDAHKKAAEVLAHKLGWYTEHYKLEGGEIAGGYAFILVLKEN